VCGFGWRAESHVDDGDGVGVMSYEFVGMLRCLGYLCVFFFWFGMRMGRRVMPPWMKLKMGVLCRRWMPCGAGMSDECAWAPRLFALLVFPVRHADIVLRGRRVLVKEDPWKRIANPSSKTNSSATWLGSFCRVQFVICLMPPCDSRDLRPACFPKMVHARRQYHGFTGPRDMRCLSVWECGGLPVLDAP
jgi:hypothetical protein